MTEPYGPLANLMLAVARELINRLDRVLGVLIGPVGQSLGKAIQRVTLKLYGVELEAQRAPVDARLAKLDTARAALEESLSAISDLQEEGIRAKAEHEAAKARLQQVLRNKGDAEKQLAEVRAFYDRDMTTFRQLAGTPNMAVERVVAFGLGILASTVATVLWTYGDDFLALAGRLLFR